MYSPKLLPPLPHPIPVTEFVLVLLVVVLCLVFTYTNGVQDGSAVTASVIACRAMSPGVIVVVVATFELFGALIGGSAVANAVRSVTNFPLNNQFLSVLSAALSAAILWNWLARRYGLPSSSTHALFGGLFGALFAAGGTRFIVMGNFSLVGSTGASRIVISLFASPLLGFVCGLLVLHLMTLLLARCSNRINHSLKVGQMFAAALLAFGHGANDPQKTMGIIMLAITASGLHHENHIPFWARLSTGCAIALGVASMAPRIVRRVGSGIFRMRTLHGFASEASAGVVVFLGSCAGFPLSTSQVVSSAVVGVGTGQRIKDVHWLVAGDILISWLLTMPLSAALGMAAYELLFRRLYFVSAM